MTIPCSCIWLFILIIFTFVYPDDTLSDEVIFGGGAFDETLSESKATDSATSLKYLKGIFLAAEASGATVNFNTYGADTRFFGSAFAKITKQETGSLYAGCIFNYFLFASAHGTPFSEQYRFQSPDPERIHASLSEFYFSTDIRKLVFIRTGKQLVSWGATYFWSPEDFINQQRAQADVLAPIDIRTGKPGLKLHLPLDRFNLSLFTDFSHVTVNKSPQPVTAGIGQAWRIDGTFSGVNIGTAGYIAKNAPVHLGLDATANLLSTDIYGEAAFCLKNEDHDAVTNAFSVGAARYFGKEKNWIGRIEIYSNDSGYADTAISTLPPGSFVPFYSGKLYFYGEISANNLLQSRLDATLFSIVNAADESFSATLQGTFDLPGIIPFTLYTRYFGGKDDREFTFRYGQNSLQAGLRIIASF